MCERERGDEGQDLVRKKGAHPEKKKKKRKKFGGKRASRQREKKEKTLEKWCEINFPDDLTFLFLAASGGPAGPRGTDFLGRTGGSISR